MDEEVRQFINGEVERRIAEYSRNDADKHRTFLESMFKRITLAIGILVVIVVSTGTFMFGKSLETASTTVVNTFLRQEGVTEILKKRVDKSVEETTPELKQKAREAVLEAFQAELPPALTDAVEGKIEEVKNLSEVDLIKAGLKGEKGDRGEASLLYGQKFCVLQAGGGCPTGFSSGQICIDSEDEDNRDNTSGTVGDSGQSGRCGGSSRQFLLCCKTE